jgi:hypothetical protein
MRRSLAVPVLLVALSVPACAETLADRLLAGYERITSVTCEIRKDSESAAGRVRMLSRVHYQRPDCLHVENVTPLPRRIIADGTNLYSYITGDARGFCRPIDRLDDDMRIELRKVPGTAMDHLLRLRGIAETALDPTSEFPVRRGYDTGRAFTVLSLDATGRLARIEFFTASDLQQKRAQYNYSAFQLAADGVWIPCLHQAELDVNGETARETVRVGNLSVDTPIAPSLFLAGPFFKGVKFVDSYEKVYE